MDISALLNNMPLFHSALLLIILIAVCGLVAVTVWLVMLRCNVYFVILSYFFFAAILVLGLSHIHRKENVLQERWKQDLVGQTRSIAQETEVLGHWKIEPKKSETPTTSDSQLFQNIRRFHNIFRDYFPPIDGIYTIRRDGETFGQFHWVVAGKAEQSSEQTSHSLYSLHAIPPDSELAKIYARAFQGEIAVLESAMTHGSLADWAALNGKSQDSPAFSLVSVVAPLYNPDNQVEAVLRIDFRWDRWQNILWQTRNTLAQLLALTLFLYLGGLCIFATLLRTVNRLRSMNGELVVAKQAADEGAKAKSDFLANMSHEIRTPMNAMIGFTEILTQRVIQNSSPSERESIESISEIIRKSGQDLLTMINDILDFSRIEANLLELESEPFSIKTMLEDIWKIEMANVISKRLDFTIKYKEPIPELILGDPTRLRQILTCLIDNAIKFTEAGAVTVHCKAYPPPSPESGTKSGIKRAGEDSSANHYQKPHLPDSMMIRFDIIDSGIGISPSQIEALFQPFTQMDGSRTRRYGGTGLGLSIAKRLAQLMDGDILVTSKPHVGSTFSLVLHVYLPSEYESTIYLEKNPPTHSSIEHSSLTPPASLPEPAAKVESPQLPLRNARILLVEDMPVNQIVISSQLRDAGAMVEIEGNGELGLKKISQDEDNGLFFDVVLMDMQMPVMDGYEATKQLRVQGYKRPIIAVTATAHALSGDREKTLGIGCDDYISKPVDRATLIGLVKKYLNSAE